MTKLEKLIYTAKAYTTGGRDGGVSPSTKLVAGKKKIPLPADLAVDADIDLGATRGAFGLAARLHVSLPGMEQEIAQALTDAAHEICPYSNATRGNIEVAIHVDTSHPAAQAREALHA